MQRKVSRCDTGVDNDRVLTPLTERKQAVEAAKAAEAAEAEKAQSSKRALEDADNDDRPAKTAKTANVVNKDVPDEYLPPNKILFVRPVTKDMDDDSITQPFKAFPGYKETRIIRVRDLAFVEFADEDTSAVAKAALQNLTINGTIIKVTFRRA